MHAKSQYRILEFLTESFAGEDLAAILWPEAATPSAIIGQYQVHDWATQLSQYVQMPIWMGNIGREGGNSYNICAVVDPDKGLQSSYYAKRRRVPFGEYVPFRRLWPWMEKFVPVSFDLTPGGSPKGIHVEINGEHRHMGCLICYEDIFPELAIDTVHAGADFFFVVTNGAWYGEEDQAMQHFAHSILRARETARIFIRCGNGGASGWIDPLGNVRELLTRSNHGPYFRGTGQLTIKRWPKLENRETFYVKTNGLLPWLIGGFSVLYLMQILFRQRLIHRFLLLIIGLSFIFSFSNHSLIASDQFQGDYLRAQAALEAGLPHLARRGFLNLAQDIRLDDAAKMQVLRGQIDAAIACGDLVEAEALLAKDPNQGSPAYQLRKAFIGYSKGDWFSLESLKEGMILQLEDRDRAWGYLLQGLFEMHQNNIMTAESLLNRARDAAKTSPQEAWIETIILENKVRYGIVDDQLLKNFEAQLSKFRFKDADDRLIESYALALATVGREGEALIVLEKALQKTPKWNQEVQSRLYFLMGVLGKSSPKSVFAFQKLILGNYSLKIKKHALYQLALIESENEFFDWLSQLIERLDSSNLLLADCLFLRSCLLLSKKELERAQEDALLLLKNFSEMKVRALEVLASINWLKGQYHAAADYFLQWKNLNFDPVIESSLNGWIGDAYFMEGEWKLAVKFYREALALANDPNKSLLLIQLVKSHLKQDNINGVQELLEHYPASRPDFLESYWIYIQYLQESGRSKVALDKIQTDQLVDVAIVPLKYEILMLQVRCLLDENRSMEALHTVRTLNEMLRASGAEQQRIQSEALLLETEVLLSTGDYIQAKNIMTQLRQIYPETKATEISYLLDGRFLAKHGKIVEAQQTMMQFVKDHPRSEFAPIGLFEAALLASNRGLKSSTEQALKLFEQIVRDYPQSELILFARLEQGKLLCELGDFEAALILYGSLEVEEQQPEWVLLQMARGNCLLAQLPEKASAALGTFERLLDRPFVKNIDKVEAQYKLGYVFFKTGKFHEAEEVYWQLMEPFFVHSQHLEPTVEYWVSRATLDLGEILENRKEWKDVCKLYEIFLKLNFPGSEVVRNRLERILSSF